MPGVVYCQMTGTLLGHLLRHKVGLNSVGEWEIMLSSTNDQ